MRAVSSEQVVGRENLPTRHTTIGSLIDDGLGIFAYCLDCEFGHEVDLERYARDLGRKQSVLPVHLVPKLRCPDCRSKNVAMVLVHPGGDVSAEQKRHVMAQWRAPYRDD